MGHNETGCKCQVHSTKCLHKKLKRVHIGNVISELEAAEQQQRNNTRGVESRNSEAQRG